jgi:hypothetical protein
VAGVESSKPRRTRLTPHPVKSIDRPAAFGAFRARSLIINEPGHAQGLTSSVAAVFHSSGQTGVRFRPARRGFEDSTRLNPGHPAELESGREIPVRLPGFRRLNLGHPTPGFESQARPPCRSSEYVKACCR